MKPKYKYRPVTNNGAGVHGKPMSLKQAQEIVIRLRDPEHLWYDPSAEVEREQDFGSFKRYWMWRGGRWKVWDGALEATEKDLSRWG